MATVNIAPPEAVSQAGSTGQPPIRSFTASSTVLADAFVVLSGGNIATATANVAANIAGIAIHNSSANYGGSEQTAPSLTNVFGYSQVNTPLVPATAGQTLVAILDGPVLVEINLSAVTGWISGGTYQANLGTAVGLGIDSTTGFFVADPNASNKVATVVEKIYGPGFGDTGDLAARVRIQMYPAALAV